ncbi:MAG: hypothetical protein A2Y33_04200 [Spirochaetes bacterium GWF1_51_8]|nr:MAG: hypothetical protein A2Y33_04200 [Spirochaetes bacterium GWF1_51_8]
MKLFFIGIFLLSCGSVYPQATNGVTVIEDLSHKVDAGIGLVFNRTLGTKLAVPFAYTLEWKKSAVFEAGYEMDLTHGMTGAYFFSLGWNNILDTGAGVYLKFLGDPNGEYGLGANSVIPYAELRLSGFILRLGVNFRFTVSGDNIWNIFYYNTPEKETQLYYLFGYGFGLLDGRLRMEVLFGNHERFFAGNFGNYGLYVRGLLDMDDPLGIYLDLGWINAGSIALSSVWYKIKIDMGVTLKW